MQWSDTTNLTGILQEIRRGLKQPTTGGFWDDRDFLRRANLVMRDICRDTECLKTIDSSNTSVSGTADYNKPTGCSRIIRVAYGNTRLFGILKAELDMNSFVSNTPWQTLTGDQARYIENNTSITIVPTPTDTGTVIYIEYLQQPTELANVTDIPFNSRTNLYEYHDLIAIGFIARCLLEDRSPFYQQRKKDYDIGIERMKKYIRDMPDTLMTTILISGRSDGRAISPMPLNRSSF